ATDAKPLAARVKPAAQHNGSHHNDQARADAQDVARADRRLQRRRRGRLRSRPLRYCSKAEQSRHAQDCAVRGHRLIRQLIFWMRSTGLTTSVSRTPKRSSTTTISPCAIRVPFTSTSMGSSASRSSATTDPSTSLTRSRMDMSVAPTLRETLTGTSSTRSRCTSLAALPAFAAAALPPPSSSGEYWAPAAAPVAAPPSGLGVEPLASFVIVLFLVALSFKEQGSGLIAIRRPQPHCGRRRCRTCR